MHTCRRAALWLPKQLEFWHFLDFSDSATLLGFAVYYAEVASGSVHLAGKVTGKGRGRSAAV